MPLEKYVLNISVVLYKTPIQHLKSFFGSIRLLEGRVKVFVIDNSPTSELEHYVLLHPNVEYIHRSDNPGYGAGHNVGIKKTIEEGVVSYHLVLNADISFESDILSSMVEYMNAHQSVGQMMPKILNPDGSIQYLCKLCPSPFDLFLRGFVPKNISKKMRDRFELRFTNYGNVMFVPYLSGCFMLLRRSVLESVGLFDERFFMYPEDIDLTRRIAEKNETVYYPLVSARHEHGAASKKSVKMFLIHVMNLVRYFNKWGWFFDFKRKKLNRKTLSLLSGNGVRF